jgi:GT2 family glycosyltransferase
MEHPKVSVIILTWNNYEDTKECLDSLRKITYLNYGIIVVDNGSKDGSTQRLQKEFPEHIYIYNKDNLGFSAGNNIAIKYALREKADYILLLNNDVAVDPRFLDFLIEADESNSEIGILVPKINYYSKPNKIWLAGGYISKIRGSGFPIGKGKGENQYNKNRYITFSSGCCMLIKKEVFKKIGLWDENYFLYGEDIDFCKRTTDAGFKILYVSDSKIYHKVSMTSKKLNLGLLTYYATRNRLYFSKKLCGYWFYIFFLYLIVTTCLVKFIIWKLRKKEEEIYYSKIAIRDFLRKKMGEFCGV